MEEDASTRPTLSLETEDTKDEKSNKGYYVDRAQFHFVGDDVERLCSTNGI